MGYIMDLRKVVGHRPLLQVGASVIVVDECGRILLQLRSDNNTWGYAGGSVEIDENVEDTAKRELYEETGLIAKELTLLGFFQGEICITFIPMVMKYLILILFLSAKTTTVS